MSISTFLIMLTLVLFTYIVQFLIVRDWILDYEKKNVKVMYDQIQALSIDNSLNYIKYFDTFDIMEIDFTIYNSSRDIIFLNGNVTRHLFIYDLPSKISINFKNVDGDEKIILNAPINFENKQVYIYLEKDIEIYEDFIKKMVPIMFVAIFSIMVISLLAGMFVSKKFVKKLNLLKLTMESVRDDGISSRVVISNQKDEFEKIGVVFNSMMDEVEKSFNLQKQFIQDASHELRTPLTILKGHLKMLDRWGKNDEGTLDKSLKIVLAELERLIKLVNDLLYLTKVEDKLNIVSDYVDVNKIVEEVIYGFDVLKSDVEFIFVKKREIYFKISEEHLKQLIIIFVDNSIKYCDKDIKIINVDVRDDDFNLYISIRDNGIGIEENEIDKVMDKFYRVDKSRKYNNSFGIGLSIASKIVKLYGGEIKIKSEFGKFTEVIVKFKK